MPGKDGTFSFLYFVFKMPVTFAVHAMIDCWKCRCTISNHWLCNVSSFAPVSPAHVRLTEHGSMPSHCPALCLLARKVGEWRMRWHLYVSVCSLMTQHSTHTHTHTKLTHTLNYLPLQFYSLCLCRSSDIPSACFNCTVCLIPCYSVSSSLHVHFLLWILPKKTCLTWRFLGKLSKAGREYHEETLFITSDTPRQPM